MYSQADIEDAIAAGALAPEQAANLRDYVAARNGVPTADEEYFRFLNGFNDLFVTYACFFALIALGLLGALVPVTTQRIGPMGAIPLLPGFLVAAGAWGLSELFLRRRGYALAGIVLACLLGLGALFAMFTLSIALIAGSGAASPISLGVMGAISAGLAAVAVWLHWRRFAVPAAVSFYLSLGTLGILLLVVSLVAMSPAAGTIMPVLLIMFGIALFAYALSLDMQDPRRITTRSEVGLWVHWPASGFIAFGVSSLLGASNGITTVGGGVGMVVLFLLFTLVGLIIDRRQYVSGAISPLMAALTAMFGGVASRFGGRSPFGNPYAAPYGPSPYGANPYQPGFGAPGPGMMPSPFAGGALAGTTVTFLVVALLMLLVVLLWRPLRRGLLALVPDSLRARLPGVDQGVVAETYTFQ